MLRSCYWRDQRPRRAHGHLLQPLGNIRSGHTDHGVRLLGASAITQAQYVYCARRVHPHLQDGSLIRTPLCPYLQDGSLVQTMDADFRGNYVKRYMVAQPLIECSLEDPEFVMMFIIGGLVILMYGVGLQVYVSFFSLSLSKVPDYRRAWLPVD